MGITNGGAATSSRFSPKWREEKRSTASGGAQLARLSRAVWRTPVGSPAVLITACLSICSCAVENVLGEIGRGNVIAFKKPECRSLKLRFCCVGAAKNVLAELEKYAKQRKAFGLGDCRVWRDSTKLAELAIRILRGIR